MEDNKGYLFSLSQKGNHHLEKAVLVGVFNPIKGDFSSGSLNNVKVYDMMSYTFKDDFGFSQTEVSELITKFSLEQEVKERIQQWYNGGTISQLAM
ncbi:MAG: AAA family ATPase [Candidatus Midichloria sp.]|nr:AAA family ATPase [Candidatus Midichloria sp.]